MKRILLCISVFVLCCGRIAASDDPALDRVIDLPKARGTLYEMLNIISENSGMLFIYNTKTIDNNRKAKIRKGQTTLKQAILDVTQDYQLEIKVIGNHILLHQPENEPVPGINTPDTPPDTTFRTFLSVGGTIRDRETQSPLPYASIRVAGQGIGTVANQNGEFLLKIPDSLMQASLVCSYVGYENLTIPVKAVSGIKNTDILLSISVVSIPEIIVNITNPLKVIRDMLDNRALNYNPESAYLTTFYREGVDYKKGFVSLTEAVFKIYKQPFEVERADQIKLLKMRKIGNDNFNDSILLKLKAGPETSLFLDIVKNLPDFLVMDEKNPYNYAKISTTVIDSRPAHIIAFEQKTGINAPLYKGELYISIENPVLLGARFEINPAYIKKARNSLVVKQSKGVDIAPQAAVYKVSYKELNGKYYLNYIRVDLSFSVKRKHWFLNRSSTINSFFEMATSKIETAGVKPFPGKESLPATRIFSETKFVYDNHFWGDFNIILPEQKLTDEIERITSKIEESEE